jgi:hypothetical protein
MNNWYKISQQQNQNDLSELLILKSQMEEIESVTRDLSTQYLALSEKDKDKSNTFYDEKVAPYMNQRRKIRELLEQEIKRLLSLGLLNFEDAKSHGYRSGGHEQSGWEPLPPVLYHVNTAKSKVIQEG